MMKKQIEGRRFYHKICGVAAAVSIIFIFLISAFEIAAYGDFGFYEEEYEKYDVASDLYMEMPDIMEVTRYMMSYLRGGEDKLSIETKVEGNIQDFFNEQDRFHMEEVRNLFLGGLMLRRIAFVILMVALVVLMASKGDWKNLIPKMYEGTLAVFIVVTGVLGFLFAQDFNKYFVIFHHIFFDNDQWIFDPATDYMIRMLPEGFFYDMTMRIGMIFIGMLVMMLAAMIIFQLVHRYKNKRSL